MHAVSGLIGDGYLLPVVTCYVPEGYPLSTGGRIEYQVCTGASAAEIIDINTVFGAFEDYDFVAVVSNNVSYSQLVTRSVTCRSRCMFGCQPSP
jgi:hypothetical protein